MAVIGRKKAQLIGVVLLEFFDIISSDSGHGDEIGHVQIDKGRWGELNGTGDEVGDGWTLKSNIQEVWQSRQLPELQCNFLASSWWTLPITDVKDSWV